MAKDIAVVGCPHRLIGWRHHQQLAIVVQHGANYEAKRLFYDDDFKRIGEDGVRKLVQDWVNEIHEYESAIGDR